VAVVLKRQSLFHQKSIWKRKKKLRFLPTKASEHFFFFGHKQVKIMKTLCYVILYTSFSLTIVVYGPPISLLGVFFFTV
jgi:hypothetical protein